MRLENICKSYGGLTVLDNFSAVIPEGEVTCLMGPSGCGKTTLLHILLGITPKDAGVLTDVPAGKAAVFQEDRLCRELSVEGNIRLVTGKAVSRSTILEHLRQLGIEEAAQMPAQELSGGMARRCAIARAVLAGAELLVLDEPFKGLDDETKQMVMDYVKRHTKKRTVLLVTHDRAEAEYFGGSLIEM